jgi:hypothetical protein
MTTCNGQITAGKGASADHPAGARRWVVLPRVREQSSLCTVSSVRDLRPEHLPLGTYNPFRSTSSWTVQLTIAVQQMNRLAQVLAPSHTKAGYHIPPFSSVAHLHLHVFVPPFTKLGRVKYPVSGTEQKKGLGWFVTGQQVEGALKRGERVTLGRG